MLITNLVFAFALRLDTLSRLPLPQDWASAKFLSCVSFQNGSMWCVNPFEHKVMRWQLSTGKTSSMDVRYKADSAGRVRPIGFWIAQDRFYISYAPLPVVLIYDTSGKVLDTVHLDTTGCGLYPLSYPIARPDGGIWLYTDRWDKEVKYDHWLHYYSPGGEYVRSHFPMNNYAMEGNLSRFSGVTGHYADIDSAGDLWACEIFSYLIWHFSGSGQFLGTIGARPEGYRVPKPVAYSQAHGDRATVQKLYQTWNSDADLFTGVFLAGQYILSQMVRRRPAAKLQHLVQVYEPNGNYLGILELSVTATDRTGKIYSFEGDSLFIVKISQ